MQLQKWNLILQCQYWGSFRTTLDLWCYVALAALVLIAQALLGSFLAWLWITFCSCDPATEISTDNRDNIYTEESTAAKAPGYPERFSCSGQDAEIFLLCFVLTLQAAAEFHQLGTQAFSPFQDSGTLSQCFSCCIAAIGLSAKARTHLNTECFVPLHFLRSDKKQIIRSLFIGNLFSLAGIGEHARRDWDQKVWWLFFLPDLNLASSIFSVIKAPSF